MGNAALFPGIIISGELRMIQLGEKCYYCNGKIIELKIEIVQTEFKDMNHKTEKETRREAICNGRQHKIVISCEDIKNKGIIWEKPA